MPCETFHCRAKKTPPQFWSLHILKQLGLQNLEFLFNILCGILCAGQVLGYKIDLGMKIKGKVFLNLKDMPSDTTTAR